MNLGRRKTGSEYTSHIKKFLSQANDPLRRLKSLRSGLDKVSVPDAKQIMLDYYAPAFYSFHASFTQLESSIKDRISKGRAVSDQLREMMEVVLPSLERFLILLPEMVQDKWQYNSICLVIRKLLHPENSNELRQWGIKLVVLWLQALQDHAGDACIELFATAIPHFPPKKTPHGLPTQTTPLTTPSSSYTLCERYGHYSSNHTTESSKDWVSTQIIYPIYSVQSSTTDPTLALMEYLLTCLSSQVCRLKWNDPSNHCKAFSFLFFQFKLFYLVCLYKNFRSDAGLYSQLPPPLIKLPTEDYATPPTSLLTCNTVDTQYVHKKMHTTSKHVTSVSAVIKLDFDTSAPIYQTIRHLILKFVLKWIMPGFHSNRPGSIQPKIASPSPALFTEEHNFTPDATDLMREMWFASRDNINLLFEICHQAFLLPLSHPGVVNKLTELYLSWVQDSNRPLFMQPPPKATTSLTIQSTYSTSPAPSLSILPWEAISGYNKFDRSDVRAGLQPSLKMFIAHTSQLFLHETKPGTTLENLIESGRRILRLYQEIVQQWILDADSWLYLLTVLLHLTIKLLYEGLPPPSNRDSTLGGSLADLLLQTLLVSYIRASMVMTLPGKYWDELLTVLSSLTQWKEIINQWSEIMRNMTHCLAYIVYKLDMDDLPLKQLSDDSNRSRTKTIGSTSDWKRKKSFSDVKPRQPLKHAPLQVTISATGGIKIAKASTVEVPMSPPLSPPEKRRASSPGTRFHGSLVSTAPVTKKEILMIQKEVSILENENDDDDGFLHQSPSDTALSSFEETNNNNDDVIANVHILGNPDIQENMIEPSVESPKSALVISNEDVSSESGHESTRSDSITNNTSTIDNPLRIRRSFSESISIRRLIRSNAVEERRGSKTPDPSVHNNIVSTNGFTHYIPTTTACTNKSDQTPPSNSSPSQPNKSSSSNEDITDTVPDTVPDTSLLTVQHNSMLIEPDKCGFVAGEGHWTPSNVSLVWQHMVHILWDINTIDSPINHAHALRCVAEIWSKLQEMEANLGISMDSKSTPSLPHYMPPLNLFLPWAVKACSLSHDYQDGRKLGYQLLCDMTLRHVACSAPPLTLYPHFYRLIHCGLQPISDVINVTIKSGCHLLSYGLPGSSILLHDCIVACTHLLNSKNSEVPRVESLTLLGSMYYLLRQYSSTPLPVPVSGGDTILGNHLKERLVATLLNAAIKDQHRSSRCLALYQVTIFAYSELTSVDPSKTVTEAIDILLATLKFPDNTLVMSSIDMLTLLSEQSTSIHKHFPSYISVLLCGISSAGAYLLTSEDIDKKAEIINSVLLCLRDWIMSLPIKDLVTQGHLTDSIISNMFKVLHAAANIEDECVDVSDISSPVKLVLAPLESSPPRTGKSVKRRQDVSTGSFVGDHVYDITVTARAVLSHLMNCFSHFPFLGGAACLFSTICEYHDSPSLQYLDELSPEIFDSPRVQFLALNGNAVLTVIEIPIELAGLPTNAVTANYQCRLIIRDISGKYSWDASILYGYRDPVTNEETGAPSLSLIKSAESVESLLSMAEDSTEHILMQHPMNIIDPLTPPTWRNRRTENDLLHDLLVYEERTSPECVLFPGISLAEPAPPVNETCHAVESILQRLLEQQNSEEQSYQLETDSLLCMQAEPLSEPDQQPTTFAFHYCRLLLSHMGLLSWQKRNSIQLLEKNDQLIRELKHLDTTQTQCRQTYKMAVLYVACGQEDKTSVLNNRKASRAFEEFVAGLGWEVDMSTHGGYMGGLSTKYSTGCTMPYYATPSEEIIFHVSTRMPSSGDDIGQKVRHLGNDEVHIVWSEHWRDYRPSIFKTQFADVLIIIYPLPNGLYRIQIDKKNNIQFGPLFNGAVVDGTNLSSLVRATAINALRAQRSPLCMYRGRYQDRWRYLKSVMSKSVECCYEDFAQCVIHPLQTNTSSTNSMSRLSPTKPFMYSNIQSTFSSSLTTVSSSTYETRWASHQSRARSRTLNEEEPSPTHEKGKQIKLHQSVPDSLHDLSS